LLDSICKVDRQQRKHTSEYLNTYERRLPSNHHHTLAPPSNSLSNNRSQETPTPFVFIMQLIRLVSVLALLATASYAGHHDPKKTTCILKGYCSCSVVKGVDTQCATQIDLSGHCPCPDNTTSVDCIYDYQWKIRHKC